MSYYPFAMMTIGEQFLTDIEAFLEKSGMTPTAFGKEALGDPGFVFDLRSGRSPSIKTIDRVRVFMSAHQEGEVA